MNLSERIVFLRKQRKLTQEKVGELLNMSQRSVANWESGDRSPSLSTLIELSEIFNVSLDYLLGKTDNPEREKQPAAQSSELMGKIIARVLVLSDPALSRLSDFLEGLEAAEEIAKQSPAGNNPGNGSAG